MARDLKLTIGAVNITTHPHSTATYKALFKAAFTTKLSIHLTGQRYAILGSANAEDEVLCPGSGRVSATRDDGPRNLGGRRSG